MSEIRNTVTSLDTNKKASNQKEDTILEVNNLTISFRTNSGLVRAVRDISFELKRGKTLAIVGESGSGKSVTSKAILGISAGNSITDSGEILYDGMDLLKIDEDDMYKLRGDRIAMIFQDPLSSLNPIIKIGKQITEAMILKNKTSRVQAKKDFNERLAILSANAIEATGEEEKVKELAKTFDTLNIEALQLETKYNDSYTYAEELKADIEEFLFLVEKKQKVDTKAAKKNLKAKLAKVNDELFRRGNEAEIKKLETELDNADVTLVDEKLSEETTKTLNSLTSIIDKILAQTKPNFLGFAYLAHTSQADKIKDMEIEKANELSEQILQSEFLVEFKEYTKKAIINSHEKSLEKKENLLPALKEAADFYSAKEYTKKDALAKAKEISALVKDSIDTLETHKDSEVYTFGSSLNSAIERYFKAVKNNPKEEKRYASQTAKRDKLIAKGKTIDWKVLPKVVYDLDELKANIVAVPDDLKHHYQGVVTDYDIDFDKRTEKLIESFRKTASKVVEKVTPTTARETAIRLMEEVGIPEPRIRYNQYPFEFSGGMRQRIVIAIALSANPEILICDEPTTALDVTIQAQILELINKLKKERNLSVIFITHDLGVVANMADEIAVMYAGKIVEKGTVDDIFYDPRHPYTWALLSSMPDLDTDEKLDAIPGTPPNMIYPPKGDAFAARNKYALEIDFEEQPPLFEISETHSAATWLLHPNAPKVETPASITSRIERMRQKNGGAQ